MSDIKEESKEYLEQGLIAPRTTPSDEMSLPKQERNSLDSPRTELFARSVLKKIKKLETEKNRECYF